jgi:hypothetical protein
MQTLYHLGLPLVGSEQWDFKSNSYLHRTDLDSKYQDKITQKNPKGFWDIPIEYLQMYLDYSNDGRVIKLLGDFFIRNIYPPFIEKVIFCYREDHLAQAKSCIALAKLDLEYLEEEVDLGHISKDSMRYAALSYFDTITPEQLVKDLHLRNESILSYYTHNNIPHIKIKYEDMREKPRTTILDISRFLGVTNNPMKAIRNVDTYDTTSL